MLLRLGIGIALICLASDDLLGAREAPIPVVRDFVASAAGIFLLAGLWTPIMGAIIVLDELWIAFSLYSSHRGGQWIHIFLTVLTAGMAMLGPGAWSIDARLFGRRRFDFDRNRGRKPHL